MIHTTQNGEKKFSSSCWRSQPDFCHKNAVEHFFFQDWFSIILTHANYSLKKNIGNGSAPCRNGFTWEIWTRLFVNIIYNGKAKLYLNMIFTIPKIQQLFLSTYIPIWFHCWCWSICQKAWKVWKTKVEVRADSLGIYVTFKSKVMNLQWTM